MRNFVKLFGIGALAAMLSVSIRGVASASADMEKAGSLPHVKELTILEKNHVAVNTLARKSRAGSLRRAFSGKGMPRNIRMKADADLPEIMGSVVYSYDDEHEEGLWKILPNDVFELAIDGPCASQGGGYANGIFYAMDGYINSSTGTVTRMVYRSYDVATGEMIQNINMLQREDCTQFMSPAGFVWDATGNTMYGISYNADGTSFQLAKFNLNASEPTVEPVADIEGYWNSLMIDASGQLYGIRYVMQSGTVTESALYKIDKTTAQITLVGDTGALPQYMTSACIDKATGRCFWNVNPADGSGWLYEVDLATGAATPLYEFEYSDEIMGLYVPEALSSDKAPGECSNVAVTFTEASLQGSVNLTTPAVYFDQTPGEGTLSVVVLANNEEIARKDNLGFGEDTTIDIDLSTKGAGLYTFAIYATNADGDGPKSMVNDIWVGADTPKSPAPILTYADGEMRLEWTPVTETVNGGYMNAANVTYSVNDKDGVEVATGIVGNVWSQSFATPEAISEYYFTVTAHADGLSSAPGRSNKLVLGNVIPAYDFNFDTEGLCGWTVIDANDDNLTWEVYQENTVRVKYNSSLAMDDWLITPPIKLSAGNAYLIKFDAYAHTNSHKELLEVKVGNAAEAGAMTHELLPATEINVMKANGGQHFEQYFTPETDGSWYIGFHGISAKDMYYLYLANVSIEAGISNEVPGAPENLVVTPDIHGDTRAVVTFDTPSETINGNPLESLTKIELYRNDELVKTFDNPGIGVSLTYEDNIGTTGFVEYTVTPYSVGGKGVPAVSAKTYIGFGAPNPVETLNIGYGDMPGEATLSWNPVTTDINGKIYPDGVVSYNVYLLNGNQRTLLDNVTDTSYAWQAATDEQEFVQALVLAVYDGNEGAGSYSDIIPVGTPYMGLHESFAGAQLHYRWGYRIMNGMQVALGNSATLSGIEPVDRDGGYILMAGEYAGTGADLFSGLISLEGISNPAFTFYTNNVSDGINPNTNDIYVSVRKKGEPEFTVLRKATVDEICRGLEGWQRVSVDLSEYAGEQIQVQLSGVVNTYTTILFDNLNTESLLDNDLSLASVSMPAKVKAGADFSIKAFVENSGTNACADYKVQLFKNNELVAEQPGDVIERGNSKTFEFPCTMSPLEDDAVKYMVNILFEADERPDDNKSAIYEVNPIASRLPGVNDLTGTIDTETQTVNLTWSKPAIESDGSFDGNAVTESFEDGGAFASEFGDWIFIDGDDSTVGGFNNFQLPGITGGSTKGSFWIWDTAYSNLNAGSSAVSFKAHSGSKYLFSLYRYDDGQADDYAVSPPLSGDAQTISFYARSYNAQYPEKIEVLYSTGGTEVSDFAGNVAMEAQEVPYGGDNRAWTKYEVALPAGAKYFAIHSIAVGGFMLMIDDVTYVPGELVLPEVNGYNIYRDGIKINDQLVVAPAHSEAGLADGTYKYVVTAKYANGDESRPGNEYVAIIEHNGIVGISAGNAFEAKGIDGAVEIATPHPMQVSVASVDGIMWHNGVVDGKALISVPAGVYIVTAHPGAVKVRVR